MRVPFSWLKDYVEIEISASQLAEKLTAVGVPVENIEYISPDVSGVTVGQIKVIRPHPNADKLVLCNVDANMPHLLQVVTGAPNVQEGDKVPLAVHGANLAGGLKIKKTKIRGEKSEGMMCSARELGLEIKDLPQEQREGVLILPPDTPVGANVVQLYCLGDPILIFEAFANRPDQLSILGIAREAAAVLKKKLRFPLTDYEEREEDANEILDVEIRDYQLCTKYSGRVIKNVSVGPSPLWIQGRLFAAGIRPVNNVVDVTNYVMLETGQPLHAFDYDAVKGQKIVVRPAKKGERLVTLDGKERILDPSVLVIADESDPVAIAGVMGGLKSEVNPGTNTVLLESANFNPVSIRRTSMKMGLRSESSRRFEKGIDFFRVDLASKRACRLMSQMGAEVLSGEAVDSITPPQPAVIKLRPSRVNRILGDEIEREQIRNLLTGLDFKLKDDGEDFIVTAPTVRQDINEEIDLVEEVARLYGYDNIPTTTPMDRVVGTTALEYAFARYVKDLMVRCGLKECITLSLYDRETAEFFKVNIDNLLKVKNPITGDQEFLRADAVAHLLKVINKNISVKRLKLRLFEISKFYEKGGSGELKERRELTIALTGPEGDRDVDFFALKGIIQFLFNTLGINAIFSRDKVSCLHPQKTAAVLAGEQKLGIMGVVHPEITAWQGIEQEVAVARIFIDEIRRLAKPTKYKPISRFPSIQRDLAVVVDEKTPSGDVEEIIMKKGSPLIEEAFCFDVYRGEQIPPDKKSLAFSLTFSATERTLTDREVQEKIDSILEILKQKLGASLRSQ